MRISRSFTVLSVAGVALMFVGISAAGLIYTNDADSISDATSRKLKEIIGRTNCCGKRLGTGNVNLDDYHPIDPSPSSKASIRPGPIEHGTPLMPFIPKPSPPGPPKNGG